VFAQAIDPGVLKMGIDTIDLTRRKIDTAHVGAVILAVEILIRVSFLLRAFDERANVMITLGKLFEESATQLADYFAFLDSHHREQPISRTRDQRLLDHGALVQFLVNF